MPTNDKKPQTQAPASSEQPTRDPFALGPYKHGDKSVTIGGREIHVAALCLRDWDRMQECLLKLRELAGGKGELQDKMDPAIELVFLSLRRNYPEMTMEDLCGLVDFQSFPQLFEAVAEANNFFRFWGRPAASAPQPDSAGEPAPQATAS